MTDYYSLQCVPHALLRYIIIGLVQFCQVKRMIRGIGVSVTSTYSQTLNGQACLSYVIVKMLSKRVRTRTENAVGS